MTLEKNLGISGTIAVKVRVPVPLLDTLCCGPNNVVEMPHGSTDTCIIDNQEFTINTLELYLIIDGKLIR